MSKNLSTRYYQENKGSLKRKAPERYQNRSKKEKGKKVTIWSCTLKKVLSEDEKQKLVEYRKKILQNEKKMSYSIMIIKKRLF